MLKIRKSFLCWVFLNLDFEFVSDFDIRISDFSIPQTLLVPAWPDWGLFFLTHFEPKFNDLLPPREIPCRPLKPESTSFDRSSAKEICRLAILCSTKIRAAESPAATAPRKGAAMRALV